MISDHMTDPEFEVMSPGRHGRRRPAGNQDKKTLFPASLTSPSVSVPGDTRPECRDGAREEQ
jgi:hypothetical protein